MQTEEYARLFEHEDRYWWFVGRRRLALRLLSASVSPGSRVLDLGCGTGAVLAEVSERYEATGLDRSELALAFSAKRGLRRLVQGDGSRLPFASDSFEGIVALDIFEHIEDDRAAFAEAFRVLTPGGALVLSVPAFRWLWGPHDVALMHQRRYRLPQIVAELERVGFVVERASYSVFLLFPAVVLVRLRDKLRRGPAKVDLPPVPDWLNRFLVRVQDAEGRWTARRRLPWGSSVVAVARKPRVR
jgi:SAM-dependent methyltransferase